MESKIKQKKSNDKILKLINKSLPLVISNRLKTL